MKKIGMPVPEGRAIVTALFGWNSVDMSEGLIRRAWAWMDRAQVSYWDALIVAAAEASGCRWVLTEDMQHQQTFESVTILNPFLVSPEELGLTVPA